MAKILYGQPVAEAITAEALKRAQVLRARGIVPALALVSTDQSGARHLDRITDTCAAAGVEVYCANLPGTSRLKTNIDNINRDTGIHGAVFMRPLPDAASEDLLRNTLNRFKDVDGVTLSSLAAIFVGHGEAFVPCPAKAAMEVLDYYGVPLSGRRVTIIGRSLVIGKPLSMLLLERDATVTFCNSKSRDIDAICRESDVVDAVCRQTGIERYTPSRFPLNLSLSDRLPADVAQRTNAVPLLIRGDVLVVAMMDPLDIDALDRIEIVTDREVEPVMCLRQEFTQLYAALYGHFNTMDGVMESFTALPDQPVASDDLLIASETPKDELGQPDEAPVVRLVNSILTQAVRESASDIHISPEKDSIQIRFRIDGKLRKTPSPPKSVGASIVSRIKILANMDISITRVPQDGRFTMMVDRREINVRVSTLPTIYGENVVMRLLDMSTNHVYTLDKLGMSDKDCKTISQTIERPYGMILSTGPTGSGKSTSLYSILQLLNKPDVNAITLEDPVEYRIDGIRQVQLNVRAGMTFASGLRSILRQDPDVIMVGEIRDSETAQIAVQAALTGHLVLSTLHTNDAPGAVSRLMEMHIEPYLVASVLLCSFAQRLVRKVCPHCAEPYDPPRALLGLFGIKDAEGATFRRGKGCYHCGNTGYLGRIGIFEVMPVTPEIQEAIVRRAHAQEISAIAQRQGVMNTLAQDAARKVRAGITTVEEALRAAMV